MKHRRLRERRAVSIPCEVVRQRDFQAVATAGTLDLSEHGMRLKSNAKLLTGEEVFVSFLLPGEGIVAGEATVARMVHGRRPIDRQGRAIGLAFDDLDSDSQRRLQRFLA
jgi:c-di-GMP-binding flagellar brake protein YcgR